MFKIKQDIIFPGLLHLCFRTQYEVTSSFLRLQEFYESPYSDIQGQFFTLEQYMDVYAKDRGNFTYTSDWSGFNVPGHVVEEFLVQFAHGLLEKEKHFLRYISEIVAEHEWPKYYVIASSDDGGNKNSPLEVMKHEIAHGMWYLNEEYKKEMMSVVKRVRSSHPCIAKTLKTMGYCEDVVDDEIHAYFATSSMTYLADSGFEDCEVPWELVLDAQRIFEKYYDELTESKED